MGKNHSKKFDYGNIAGLLLIGFSVIMATGLFTFGQNTGAGSQNTAVLQTICNIFNDIKNIIFVLGLALMILGGALYAGANLMPSQSRGGFQGYGMAMIIGGVIGVAIAVAAPFILNTVLTASGSGSYIVNSGGSTVAVSGVCSSTYIAAAGTTS